MKQFTGLIILIIGLALTPVIVGIPIMLFGMMMLVSKD